MRLYVSWKNCADFTVTIYPVRLNGSAVESFLSMLYSENYATAGAAVLTRGRIHAWQAATTLCGLPRCPTSFWQHAQKRKLYKQSKRYLLYITLIKTVLWIVHH